MPYVEVWSATEGPDRVHKVASREMLVVSVVLGKSLLEQWGPECLIGADSSEHCPVATGVPMSQRQPVVDDDCVRDAKGIEVDGVDSIWAQLVLISVLTEEENFLHSVGFLCKCGGTGEEPAVAE